MVCVPTTMVLMVELAVVVMMEPLVLVVNERGAFPRKVPPSMKKLTDPVGAPLTAAVLTAAVKVTGS